MTFLNAEDIYAAGGEPAVRLAVRGAIRTLTRDGRANEILDEVAVPVVRLANRIRNDGNHGLANTILEHAVHDGIQAAVLADAIERATTTDVTSRYAPPEVTVGPHGGLMVGPPPAATDLASTAALANYIRDRLLSWES
jgi:hypothetical protein